MSPTLLRQRSKPSTFRPKKVKDRVFFAATGRPLVTTGDVADVIKKLIPEADIEVGSGLSEADLIEIRYRGVLSVDNGREQLGFEPQFADIEKGRRRLHLLVSQIPG